MSEEVVSKKGERSRGREEEKSGDGGKSEGRGRGRGGSDGGRGGNRGCEDNDNDGGGSPGGKLRLEDKGIEEQRRGVEGNYKTCCVLDSLLDSLEAAADATVQGGGG